MGINYIKIEIIQCCGMNPTVWSYLMKDSFVLLYLKTTRGFEPC